MITKNVNPDEVGKVFSIVGTFQALLPFVSSPIFGFLYRETVADFPQAFLLLVAALKFTEGCVVIIIWIGAKMDDKKAKMLKGDFKESQEMQVFLKKNENQSDGKESCEN